VERERDWRERKRLKNFFLSFFFFPSFDLD